MNQPAILYEEILWFYGTKSGSGLLPLPLPDKMKGNGLFRVSYTVGPIIIEFR